MRKDKVDVLNFNGCPHCKVNRKVKSRSFSDKAWSYLFMVGELSFDMIGSPICDECYTDLREVLIESHQEVENVTIPAKVSDRMKSLAG
jgi:glutaredoxin